jgi:hypothetical protein
MVLGDIATGLSNILRPPAPFANELPAFAISRQPQRLARAAGVAPLYRGEGLADTGFAPFSAANIPYVLFQATIPPWI